MDGDGGETFMMKFHPLLFAFHFIFQEIQLNVISLWMGMDEWKLYRVFIKKIENGKFHINFPFLLFDRANANAEEE